MLPVHCHFSTFSSILPYVSMGTAPIFVGFDGNLFKDFIITINALMRFIGTFDASLLPVEICAK